MDGLFDEMHSASFNQNIFKGSMQQARDWRELAQRRGEPINVENGLPTRPFDEKCGKGTNGNGLLHAECSKDAAKASAICVRI